MSLNEADRPEKEHLSEQHDEFQAAQAAPMPQSLAALSPEELQKVGKRATFKMDIWIMPILVVMFILNYLDRQNIASARLAGLEEDLGLSPVQYQTSVSILFVGYILMQVPSNMMVGKITWPSLYICLGMSLWGVISATMASVHNFAGLLVARIFIGVVESVFFPGAIYLLSLFYTRKQLAFRTAILFSGSQLGNAFGGLFAIAIMNLDGSHGLEAWRWLFLIEGVLTTGLAFIFAFLLPSSHKQIIGISSIELDFLTWNYASDLSTISEGTSEVTAWQGLVMACSDIKTWTLMGILSLTYVVGTVTNFFPSVVGTLGYDRNTTYLLTAPPFVLCVFVMWINGWHSDRTQERFLHIVCLQLIGIAANIIAVSTLSVPARYVAMMLLPSSVYGSSVVTLSWISGTLNQPLAKRAAAIALINSFANTPNIWTSYLYSGPPRFLLAFLVNLGAMSLAALCATFAYFYLRRLNAKLAKGEDTGKHGPTAAQIDAGFRYAI